MIALSPGLAQSCFELLDIASRGMLKFSEIRSSFAFIGSLPGGRVVDTSQALNWLRARNDDIAEITISGERIRNLESYESKLRQALLDYIDLERPAWIQNAIFGRARVLAFAGSEIAQVFVEANLSSGIEDEIIIFWDAISARARGQKNDKLTAIGRIGERLTLDHERARTGRHAKWISIENNADGYDVLSVLDADNPRPLSIEVKASTMGLGGTFHLTRNEWERAQEFECHRFHLWDISHESSPSIAVLTREKMKDHIPNDSGAGCWELAEIPFEAFREDFNDITAFRSGP